MYVYCMYLGMIQMLYIIMLLCRSANQARPVVTRGSLIYGEAAKAPLNSRHDSPPDACFTTFAVRTSGHMTDMNEMTRRTHFRATFMQFEAKGAATDRELHPISC